MARAKNGDLVKVHYSSTGTDGYVYDSTFGKQPLEVKLGSGTIIPGFEQAIIGMNVGDRKKLTIPKEKAFGEYRQENVIEISKSDLPENAMPKLGMKLQLRAPNGEITNVLVKEINKDKITLDANHPLAGKDLVFEIELIDIVRGN